MSMVEIKVTCKFLWQNLFITRWISDSEFIQLNHEVLGNSRILNVPFAKLRNIIIFILSSSTQNYAYQRNLL